MDHITLVELFFTITAIAVIIITVLLAVLVIYLISVFRTVRRIAKTAEFATNMVKEDLTELSSNLKQKGLSFGAFASFFKNVFSRRVFPGSFKGTSRKTNKK